MDLSGIGTKLPNRKDFFLLLTAILVPIQIWSTIHMLYQVPAWIKRLSLWDLIGMIAYIQAFALVESLLVIFIILFLWIILPTRRFSDKCVPICTKLVFNTFTWAIFAHVNDDLIRLWGIKEFLPWMGLYSLTLIFGIYFVIQYKMIGRFLIRLIDRFVILSSLFLLVDISGLFIIIIRNAWFL